MYIEMPPTSRYGRLLRPTQFYEPEATIKDDYSTDDHDSGHFDASDWTFMEPYYKRYKFDNYEPPQEGGGGDDKSESDDGSYDSSFVSSSSGFDDNSSDYTYVPSDSEDSVL